MAPDGFDEYYCFCCWGLLFVMFFVLWEWVGTWNNRSRTEGEARCGGEGNFFGNLNTEVVFRWWWFLGDTWYACCSCESFKAFHKVRSYSKKSV